MPTAVGLAEVVEAREDEEDTDVALQVTQVQSKEYEKFINHIHVGFAMVVEERDEVSEVYLVPRVTEAAKEIWVEGWVGI